MVALPKNCIPAAVQIAQFESVSLENSRFSRPKKSQKKKIEKKSNSVATILSILLRTLNFA
jgi:hypothetical protein